MLDFPPWKSLLIVLSLVLSVAFAAPNLLSEQQAASLPSWAPKAQLNLGLDLRGGSHLLLEVDRTSVIRQQVEAVERDLRATLRDLRDKKGSGFGYGDTQVEERSVSVLMRNQQDVDAAVEALRRLAVPIAGTGVYTLDVSVVDGARIVVSVTDAGIRQRIDQAVQQSIETVRRRIDELGTREPTIIRQGTDRIVIQVPGLQNPRQLKELLGKTAKLEFKLVDTEASPEDLERDRAPPGSQILPFVDDTNPDAPPRKIAVKRRTELTGEALVDAQPSFQDGQPVVSFRFDSAGARRFADLTRAYTGKPFAIVLDDEVVSAPNINEPILGGSGIISGSFTVESANNLAILLRSGALPAKLNILEERTVGPDLGADSIRAGQIASIIGTGLVVLLMIVTYGRFGIYSVIALIFNLAMLLAILTVTGATLTLPGIAGLVLTMGAAVDANVLIFERIREELRAGRSVVSAVETGYREASRAIWDANITNVIAAALMFWFGSGPIKGSAVVLTIGIVTSVYTGVTVCRWMTVLWMRRARPQKLII